MANNILLLALFSLSSVLVVACLAANPASDNLIKGRNITDGATLVSAGGSFTLGFFSPGVPNKRYLGVWFSVSEDAICWVANRDHPLVDTSGTLVLTDTGSFVLVDGSGQVVWSSNTTGATARLLESGNLVVVSGQSSNSSSVILWQSFDHPSNTLLPGMKIGKNLWTGSDWHLTSWRSASDPSPGRFRYTTDTRGAVPENVLWDWEDGVERYRTGPWNGVWFSGVPEMTTYSDMFRYDLTVSSGEVTYGFVSKPGAPLSRLLLTDDGVLRRLVWDTSTRAWKSFFQGPRDVCDAYGKCGAFGVCDAAAAATSFCGCARGFSPAFPAEWKMREASGGCRRDVALDCGGDGRKTSTTDGFLRLRGVKLPDTSNASVDMGVGLEECGARCLANCSCVAYAPADIAGGGDGSGCIMWTDGLVDLRSVDGGQDIYLRSAKSELDETKPPHRPFPTRLVIGASVASSLVVILIAILTILFVIRRCLTPRISAAHSIQPIPAPTVPSVELSSMKAATKDFHENNIIGRGGFGIVYEGNLSDGKKIAIKRLIIQSSHNDDEGEKAFDREVELMSKLRHGNLVQLLAYCKDGNERLLVYEYMKNRSLNFYILGKNPRLRATLNWEQRLEIILGIADGLAYLHKGLNKGVIHRDIKPSNILLDDNWRPKIADFGTAKTFIEDQTNPTMFQTPGYTAPEYAMQGYLTLKCDVYSFGVVLLEIISGPKDRTMQPLILYAWESWNQNRIEDLLDSAVGKPVPELLLKLETCVQIGLLCVQQLPDDRPTMSAVVTMLNSGSTEIYLPKMPILDSRSGSPLCDADYFSEQNASNNGTHSFTVDLT